MSNEVVPGILEGSWDEIERKISTISQFSKEIHIDFIDGRFANNKTFLDSAPFSKFANELYLEAHLMVEEPLQYLSSLAQAGFKRFLGHIEKMVNQEEFVAQGQLLGEVGLALDLDTPLDAIKVPFDDLDVVLVLAVKAGESGQEFQNQALEKIKILKQVQDDKKTNTIIEVDGGIDDKTLPLAKNAGATRFVSTNFISNAQNPQAAYEAMTEQK